MVRNIAPDEIGQVVLWDTVDTENPAQLSHPSDTYSHVLNFANDEETWQDKFFEVFQKMLFAGYYDSNGDVTLTRVVQQIVRLPSCGIENEACGGAGDLHCCAIPNTYAEFICHAGKCQEYDDVY